MEPIGADLNADEPKDEYGEDARPPSLFDPEVQRQYDENYLLQTMVQLREQLAVNKVNHRLASFGLLAPGPQGKPHPNSIAEDIGKLEVGIREVTALHAEMTENGIPVPTASRLEIAGPAIPPDVIGEGRVEGGPRNAGLPN